MQCQEDMALETRMTDTVSQATHTNADSSRKSTAPNNPTNSGTRTTSSKATTRSAR